MAGEKLSCIFSSPFSHLWGQAWKCSPVLNGLILEHAALMCTKTPLILSESLLSDWNGTRNSSEIQHSLSLPSGMTPMFICMTMYSYYMNDTFIYIINIHMYNPGGNHREQNCIIPVFKAGFLKLHVVHGDILVCQAVALALSCSKDNYRGVCGRNCLG